MTSQRIGEKQGRTRGFGVMLKTLRAREGLTQQELADRVGVTNSSVCLYEGGRRVPSRMTISKISKVLNLTNDEFVLVLNVAEQHD